MKGKILNVRGESSKKITENNEIVEIKKILGLEANKKYTEETAHKSLRYGRVLFMTDQDLDGSHIKGLCINLFQSEWNSLSRIPNFIGFMNTPILKQERLQIHYSSIMMASITHGKKPMIQKDGKLNITRDWVQVLALNSKSTFTTRKS